MTTTIEGRDGSAALTCLRLAGCGGYCDAGERGAHTDTLAQRELAHGFPECVRVWPSRITPFLGIQRRRCIHQTHTLGNLFRSLALAFRATTDRSKEAQYVALGLE